MLKHDKENKDDIICDVNGYLNNGNQHLNENANENYNVESYKKRIDYSNFIEMFNNCNSNFSKKHNINKKGQSFKIIKSIKEKDNLANLNLNNNRFNNSR